MTAVFGKEKLLYGTMMNIQNNRDPEPDYGPLVFVGLVFLFGVMYSVFHI